MLLFQSVQWVFGQACGKYTVQFSGTIETDQTIVSMELPTTFYLEAIASAKSDQASFAVKSPTHSFEVVTQSHLTAANQSAEAIELKIRSAIDSIPIRIQVMDGEGDLRLIRIKVPLEDVEFSATDKATIALNLGTLSLL